MMMESDMGYRLMERKLKHCIKKLMDIHCILLKHIAGSKKRTTDNDDEEEEDDKKLHYRRSLDDNGIVLMFEKTRDDSYGRK
jgi:hypothetical protein